MAWYDLPISQSYGVNGEQGVDVATPFHTPITNLYSGQVVQAQYGSAGGIVGILTNVPGLGKVVEYFLHLDLINVKVGQSVGVGQQVGISGGENPGYPGGLHPASPQFSTGPHTEFGFFRGTPFESQNAGNPQAYLHPSSASASSGNQTGTGGAPSPCDIPLFGGIVCLPEHAGQALADFLVNGPKNAGQAAATAVTNNGKNVPGASAVVTSFENIGFFILALVMIFAGFILVAYEPVQQGVREAVKGAFVA